jgi:hypothetical protein
MSTTKGGLAAVLAELTAQMTSIAALRETTGTNPPAFRGPETLMDQNITSQLQAAAAEHQASQSRTDEGDC